MKIKNIFSGFFAAAIVFGLAACSEDEPEFVPAEPSTTAGVYFSIDDPTSVTLLQNQETVSVNISREVTEGALTVNLNSTGTAEPFTVPAAVTFEAGAATAVIDVAVDFSKIEANVTYPIVISVGEDTATPYGKNSITVKALYSPWGEWTKLDKRGVFTANTPYGFDAEVEIQVRESKLDPNQVQYKIPADNGSNYGLWDIDMIINLDRSTNYVTVPVQKNGGQSNGLDIMYCDSYTLYSQVLVGNPEQYLGLSNFNPETGLMTLNIAYFMINGTSVSWWGGAFDNYLQLPGYADYTVAITSNGHWIDDEGVESQVLNIYKSKDLSSVKYEIIPGKLTADEFEEFIAELAANDEAPEITETANVSFVLDEGTYTAIAVGFADGEVKASTSFEFKYKSVMSDPNADWNSLGECMYSEVLVSSWFTNIQPLTYAVEIQEHKSQTGLYRLVNPYGPAWPYWDDDIALPGDHYITIDAQDPTAVYLYESEIGLDLGYGSFGVWSYAGNFLEQGYSLAQIKGAGYCGTMADGVIKIAVPNVLLSMANYNGGNWIYFKDSTEFFTVDLNGASKSASVDAPKHLRFVASEPVAATSTNFKASKNSWNGKILDNKAFQSRQMKSVVNAGNVVK